MVLSTPRTDPVWTLSFLHVHQLISHLDSGEGHIGAGGLSVRWGRWVNFRGGAVGGVCYMKAVEREVEVSMGK